ncbi:unnamed protein product [Caretta caretta]
MFRSALNTFHTEKLEYGYSVKSGIEGFHFLSLKAQSVFIMANLKGTWPSCKSSAIWFDFWQDLLQKEGSRAAFPDTAYCTTTFPWRSELSLWLCLHSHSPHCVRSSGSIADV